MTAAATSLPWRVPAVLGATEIVHWGSLYYAFSVLMPAIAAETGWPREAVVGAFAAGLLAEAAGALLVGPLLDRLGARVVMTAGALLAACGLYLAGEVTTLAQLYAVWIGLGAVMAATLYEPAFAAVTAAFGVAHARRGIALVVFAGGLASTVAWPATALLVQEVGWRDACTALAVLNAGCALVHLLVLPPLRRGVDSQVVVPLSGVRLGEAIRQARFWALALVYGLIGATSAAVAVHLVPLLQERGAGAHAAVIASLLGIGQVAGRIAEFAGGGRFALRTVGLAALVVIPAAFALLSATGALVLLALAVGLYGAANGVLTIVRGAVPARLFGAAHYGAIAGALASCGALARATGPIAVALLWEGSGGYALPMAMLAGFSALAALLFARIARSA